MTICTCSAYRGLRCRETFAAKYHGVVQELNFRVLERYIRRKIFTMAFGLFSSLFLDGFTAPSALLSTFRFDRTFLSQNRPP